MFLFLFSALFAALFAYISYRNNDKGWLFASFGIIVFIMAFQDDISVDFSSYEEAYKQINNGSLRPSSLFSQRDYENEVEYGWWLLNKLFGFAGSYYLISFMVCCFICSALYKICTRVPSKFHWLAVLFFYFSPMIFYMSGIRQGIAVAMFVYMCLCLLKNKYLLSIIWYLLGCTFHTSMMYSPIFLPLIFIWKIDNKRILNIICLCLSLFFVAAFISAQQIQSSAFGYVLNVMESKDTYVRYFNELDVATYSLNNILNKSFIFLFSIIAFYHSKGFSRITLFCFLISQIGNTLVGYFGNLSRIFLYVDIFAIASIAYIPIALKSKILRITFIGGLLFLVLWQFIGKINSEQFMNFCNYKTIFF